MAVVECGGIHYCPEPPSVFGVNPQQVAPMVEQTIAPGGGPPVPIGLVVDPAPGAWVLYALTAIGFQLDNAGGPVAGQAGPDFGFLVFNDTPGTPDLRLAQQSDTLGVLTVDPAGLVSVTFSDPGPSSRHIRAFYQLSAPQVMSVPPPPPP